LGWGIIQIIKNVFTGDKLEWWKLTILN